MEHYLLIARSVTHAQRMEKALEEAGVRCAVLRAPAEINRKGCSYAVRIAGNWLAKAREILSAMKVQPIHIYEKTDQGYKEVPL